MREGILCFGEVLWDALPAGLFLGGAPFNVAIHLHQLGQPVSFASRIGNDELGAEITRRLQRRGLDSNLLQVDNELPTGFVRVTLDAAGSPTFNIVEPSAWDAIAQEETLLECAQKVQAIVFGSLVQRQPVSRATLQKLLAEDVLRVFDINLRPPFDNKEIVEESLKLSQIVKLNDDELLRMEQWFGLPSGPEHCARAMAERFQCETICITRGPNGAALLHEGEWYEHPGYEVKAADCVGAGDAFLASLLNGLLEGRDSAALLPYANALGAYVATQNGATPNINHKALETLRTSS